MAVKKFCVRCTEWFGGDGEHLCQTVDDGYQFHLTASTCDNCRDEGRKLYALTVRAWDLPTALSIASQQPLAIWNQLEDCEHDE